MARLAPHLEVVGSHPSRDGEHWVLELRLSRFYWIHPSFWLARSRGR